MKLLNKIKNKILGRDEVEEEHYVITYKEFFDYCYEEEPLVVHRYIALIKEQHDDENR